LQQPGKGKAKMVVERFPSTILLWPDDEVASDDPGHHVWIPDHLLVSDSSIKNSVSATND
jgi:hypothetical protein